MKRAAVIIVLLLATWNITLLAAPQTPTEYVVGESSGLKVILRIKSPASLADNDWLQMEIINSGPPGVIQSSRIDAQAEHGGGSSSIFGLTTLGIPSDGRAPSSTGRTLLAGPFTTLEPSVWAGASLGLHRENVNVTMRLTLELTLADGRSISVSMREPAAFTWSPPTAAQLKALQQQAVALLAKATSGTPISLAETAFLRTLLAKPETAAAVTLEQALAMLRTRQHFYINEFSDYDRAVLWLVHSRWPSDPAVIAFFHEAFATRGTAALSDLVGGYLWDDSFIEPIVKLIEGGFPPQGTRPTSKLTHLGNALAVMDRHYASWSQNASMAPRLSKAALPLLHPLATSTGENPNSIYRKVNLLVLTHDPGMIDVLRPLLSDKTIDRFIALSSSMPSGVTPMRYSEVAANGILSLLGEPPLVDSWLRAKAPSGGPYPEWEEWDRKIAALQQRLDARSQ